MLYSEILDVLKNRDIEFGISNVDFSDYKYDYKCALVLAIPHKEILTIKNYREEKLEKLIQEAQKQINVLLEDLINILDKYKVNYYIPPVSQSNEETLIATFSFKYASVNAGLGWIGKNGVLITKRYGPRVRLGAILIDYELPLENPITNSKCPKGCYECVRACPYEALTGSEWNIDTKRVELINYKLCNQKRSLYIKKHNRKNSCGFCIIACPIGAK